MLDFQRGPGPRNYLSRREQWRLLLLVMMLGLVLLMAREARQPRNFAWLWAIGPAAAEPQPADRAVEGPARPQPLEAYFPGVKPDFLRTVRDDAPFVSAEQEAWFHLLDILRSTDAAALAAGSCGPVTHVQLLRQSQEYRGRLVHLRGIIRRAHRLAAPKNEYGFQHYYQVWLTPQDDPSNVVVIYCLKLPDGFPTGMQLEEDVRLVGFFFKRWIYNAQDTLRTAPVVLAGTVAWNRGAVAAAPPADARPPNITGIAAVAVLFALLVTAYVYFRTRVGGRPALAASLDERLLERSKILPGPGRSLEQLAGEDETPES